MQRSRIEWTDFTWNPITGCTNGCSYCYARKRAENSYYKKAFPFKFEPHFYPERLNEVTKVKAGSKVFVCSMGELFGEHPEWTEYVLHMIGLHPEATFQLLTKKPENLAKWSPFPPNCWVLVSAADHNQYVNGLRYLRQIEATIRGFSLEPLLHRIDVSYDTLDWVIVGSQTQPVKHPPKEWVDWILSYADDFKTPVFVKEPLASHYGINRKEFPIGVKQ